MSNIIEVKNLNKEFLLYQKTGLMNRPAIIKKAVSDISFNVEEGELLAFIGPNGAGKSTTIKMLTGILQPTSGEIKVLGLNPSIDRKKLSYEIGTMFGQKSQLWYHLPARDSFKLIGSIYDIKGKELTNRINYIVEIMELSDFIDIPVRKLSLGQRIKCEIASTLLHNPKIIFLDEPTIGLDIVAKMNLRSLIKRINKENNVTIFLTSHDIGDIEGICNRMIVIDSGKTLMDNNINELKFNYDTKRIVNIYYSSKIDSNYMNLKDIKIIKKSDFNLQIEIDVNRIDSMINEICKLGKVKDIAISSKPLEDIINNIYKREDLKCYA